MTTRKCSWETLVSPSAAAKYRDRSSTKKRSDRRQDGKRGASNGPRISGLSNLRDNSNPRKLASLLLSPNCLLQSLQLAAIANCMQAAFTCTPRQCEHQIHVVVFMQLLVVVVADHGRRLQL